LGLRATAFGAVFGGAAGGAALVAVGRGAARCTGLDVAGAVRAGVAAGGGVACVGAAVAGGSGDGMVLDCFEGTVAALDAGRDDAGGA
jgi:hypothetical protein